MDEILSLPEPLFGCGERGSRSTRSHSKASWGQSEKLGPDYVLSESGVDAFLERNCVTAEAKALTPGTSSAAQ